MNTAKLKKLKLIRLDEVQDKTGLSKTFIYNAMKTGEFPASVKITSSTVGWVEREVDDWIHARIKSRRTAG